MPSRSGLLDSNYNYTTAKWNLLYETHSLEVEHHALHALWVGNDHINNQLCNLYYTILIT